MSGPIFIDVLVGLNEMSQGFSGRAGARVVVLIRPFSFRGASEP